VYHILSTRDSGATKRGISGPIPSAINVVSLAHTLVSAEAGHPKMARTDSKAES
jgi:hypothetical protein